jgi:predicted nucleotidyltransferase
MFKRLLEKRAQALDEAQLPYMIIGGQAVLLYGEPRLTKDIDITLGATVDRLDVVLKVAKQVGFTPLVDPGSFVDQTMVLPCRDEKTGIRVDFIFSRSAYEKQALERVRYVQIGNTRVRFVSPEDLIIHKIIAGRPRDLEDVRSLLLKQTSLDEIYLRHWLEAYSEALGVPLWETFQKIIRSTR